MFQPGSKIGPYVLKQELGRGAFGSVWLALWRTELWQREVALKLPHDSSPDLDEIRREAEIWLKASGHPNVVAVLNADIYEGQVAIASEYVSGGTLATWLERYNGKAPSIKSAVEITLPILSGLQHLHSIQPEPIIHRDLKPANVLLRGTTPCITDFGISRILQTSTATCIAGTPQYMAPEMFDAHFSPQSDVWAVGIMLYQMLAGVRPFPQKGYDALKQAIPQVAPIPLPDTVPVPLQRVVLHALAKDPADRFATASDMRDALQSAMLDRSHRSSMKPLPPAPIPRPQPQRLRIGIGAALLLVIASGILLPRILAPLRTSAPSIAREDQTPPQSPSPSSLEARYQQAMQDFNEHNRPKAMEEAKAIILIEPSHIDAHKLLAACYGLDKNYEAAATEYNEATKIDPNDMEAKSGLAGMAAALGEKSEAARLFREVLRHPQSTAKQKEDAQKWLNLP